jgi:hypothetical protein
MQLQHYQLEGPADCDDRASRNSTHTVEKAKHLRGLNEAGEVVIRHQTFLRSVTAGPVRHEISLQPDDILYKEMRNYHIGHRRTQPDRLQHHQVGNIGQTLQNGPGGLLELRGGRKPG